MRGHSAGRVPAVTSLLSGGRQDREGEIAHLRKQLEEYRVAPPALVGAVAAEKGGEGGTLALLDRPASSGGWAPDKRELHSHPVLCATPS